jgi:hypothetical protein
MTVGDPYDGLIRMIGLARGLEMAGFYNAAKLLWAAAYSQELRAAAQRGIPTRPEQLGPELEAAIADLRLAGASADLIAALERGRATVARNDTIPASEIAEVHVCRTCGQVVVGDSPEACPACGAWELTFKTFPAVYYLEPLPPDQALSALASAPDLAAGLIQGLSDEHMARSPQPGEWAMREVLTHFLTSQELLAGRVTRMLAEDDPVLKAMNPADMSNPGAMSASEILERFRASRQDTVARLAAAAPDGWWRTGQHEEFGRVTVLQQASYFAKHDHNHLTQMRQILKFLNG